MAKAVGLSRSIKLEWMNKTVELIEQCESEQEIKEKLNEYLGFEIESAINLRKTRELLMNIWVRKTEENEIIRKEALKTFKREKSDKRALHWCMLLIAYPIFADVSGLIGKLITIQDTFTSSWVKDKIFEEWGERTTLLHSSDKILQTLKYIGGIENIKTGTYKALKYQITDEATTKVILMTILVLKEKAYYEISELSEVPQLFPFKYIVSHELLHNSECFHISNFGGKIVVSN